MFAVCHIIAAYSQQKLKLFSSTRYYSPSIRNKNLVLDTVSCIFVTVTLTFMYSRSVRLRNFNSYSSQSKDHIFFTGEIDSKLSPLKTLQLNGCHNCHDAKMTTCCEVFWGSSWVAALIWDDNPCTSWLLNIQQYKGCGISSDFYRAVWSGSTYMLQGSRFSSDIQNTVRDRFSQAE